MLVTFEENKFILHVLYTYPKGVQDTFGIHIRYIADTSRYMCLARFLGVTLDTYQDTSGYVYPGFFIKIHQETSGYIEIQNHDTCILDGIHVGYNLNCLPRMYPERYCT
jgi:hypothetical protein